MKRLRPRAWPQTDGSRTKMSIRNLKSEHGTTLLVSLILRFLWRCIQTVGNGRQGFIGPKRFAMLISPHRGFALRRGLAGLGNGRECPAFGVFVGSAPELHRSSVPGRADKRTYQSTWRKQDCNSGSSTECMRTDMPRLFCLLMKPSHFLPEFEICSWHAVIINVMKKRKILFRVPPFSSQG